MLCTLKHISFALSCTFLVHTQDLVPITVEMAIPFEFHRFIVGQRGRWIRALMEDHNVNIVVPSADKNVICSVFFNMCLECL